MREILFRGKRKDNGEWIEGSLIRSDVFYWEKRNEPKYYICPFTTTFEYDECYNDSEEVVPETVGQYTGLTDKNGTKIFEGDICGCFYNTQIFVVKYCEERCGYFFDDIVLSGLSEPTTECLGNLSHTIEVLGNIYDNPESLEEE